MTAFFMHLGIYNSSFCFFFNSAPTPLLQNVFLYDDDPAKERGGEIYS